MDTERRLIDLTAGDLYALVRTAVSEITRQSPAQQTAIVSGRKNIAAALGISVDKLDQLVRDGYLADAVKQNGRTMICDINKAFAAFGDEWH